MKKIFSILIIALVIVSTLYVIKEGNMKNDVDTMEELIETAKDDDEINECIVLTRSGTDYYTKKITLNFNNADVTNECLFEVKYKSENAAKLAYEEIMADEDNEEVMLDGTVLTYRNDVFNLIGMKKEDAIAAAKQQVDTGILEGYKISIEKIKQ